MNIVHPPWVGPHFASSLIRILIVGDSHYSSDSDATDMTVPVVDEWISGESNRSYRFFTHLAVAISGKEPHLLDRAEVFSQIAFYNYVQKVVPSARVSPSTADFEESELPFRAVLDELCPTHIIACGSRLWDQMPHFDVHPLSGFTVKLNDKSADIGRYSTSGGMAWAMSIRHPSSGFNGREWHPRLTEFAKIR